jgi:hypothetical protein
VRFYYLRWRGQRAIPQLAARRDPDLAARRRAVAATLAGGPPPASVDVVLAKPGVISAGTGTLVRLVLVRRLAWDLTRTGSP